MESSTPRCNFHMLQCGAFFLDSEGQLSSQELFESLLRRQKAAADVSTPGPVSEASDADASEEARERVREKMQRVGW